jgi:hypothetical protein
MAIMMNYHILYLQGTHSFFHIKNLLGQVWVHACNLSSQEAEAGR